MKKAEGYPGMARWILATRLAIPVLGALTLLILGVVSTRRTLAASPSGDRETFSERSYYGFEGKRSRKLDFDDDYIESMNKRPLDSLTDLSDADRRRRNVHLYRKRSGFGSETAETIQQVRYN